MTRPSPISLYDEPAYRAAEAAHMLALPVGTLKAWGFGQDHHLESGRRKQFRPLIDAADSKHRLLSFNNLCELHTLAAIRRHYRITMPAVRAALAYLQKQTSSHRPLLAAELLTNGASLFIQHAGTVIDVSHEGQASLSADLERDLRRVARDARGIAVKLFPVTRAAPSVANQPHFVVIDPKLAFGRPILANAGVTTSVIQDRFLAGDSPREMAEDYRVDEADIWEALRFEQRLAA
jgi:uncharacterized protein (DUF433 family)